MKSEWVRRRWFDFRQGHSLYLIFAMAFAQFVVITYTQAIERIPWLVQAFPSMWIWALFFVAAYLPTATIVGHIHRRMQMPVEAKQSAYANPFTNHVYPGKEQLFHMPMSLLSIETNLRGMELQNKQAEVIEKLAKQMGMEVQLPKFSEDQFEAYRKWQIATKRLINGENVESIVSDLGLNNKTK